MTSADSVSVVAPVRVAPACLMMDGHSPVAFGIAHLLFLVLLPRFQLQWLASAPAGFGVCEETKWTTTTPPPPLSLIPC